AAVTYSIDPSHSSAQFKVRHMMISSVRGEFAKMSGTARLDPERPEAAEVNVEIEVGSISTREPKRDEHLLSADFFDVEKYPAIQFRSTKVEEAGKGSYRVTGELTIRDVTKTVVLEVEGGVEEHTDPWGNK